MLALLGSKIQLPSSKMAASSDVYAVIDKKKKPSTKEHSETAPKGNEAPIQLNEAKGEKKPSTELLSDNVAISETGTAGSNNWYASTASFKKKVVMIVFALSAGVLLSTCLTISVLAVAEIASLKQKVSSLKEALKSQRVAVNSQLLVQAFYGLTLDKLQPNLS